ncbi:uncharacterized protein [Maniola hyperantus]|uniref:uncharacterized protein n=1 Tax=Aphantopus hyperantus TaxID=2795564 RepID=UPI00374A4CC6
MVASHHRPLGRVHEPNVRNCGSSRTEQYYYRNDEPSVGKIRGRPERGSGFRPHAPRDARASTRPGTGRIRFPSKPDTPRSSEPILIPKLRIQFADFPYLHYSID